MYLLTAHWFMPKNKPKDEYNAHKLTELNYLELKTKAIDSNTFANTTFLKVLQCH